MLACRRYDLPDAERGKSWLSKFYFGHAWRLFKRWNHPITDTDICDIKQEERAHEIGNEFERHVSEEMRKTKPLLWLAYLKTFWKPLSWCIVRVFIAHCISIARVPLLGLLLDEIKGENSAGLKVLYLAGVVICLHLQCVITNRAQYRLCVTAMSAQTAFSRVVYSNLLKLKSVHPFSLGQFTFMISNDTNVIGYFTDSMWPIALSPITCSLILIYLYFNVDKYAAIATCSYLVCIFVVPLQIFVYNLLRKRLDTISTERLQTLNSFINSAQTQKMNCTDELSFRSMLSIFNKEIVFTWMFNLLMFSNLLIPYLLDASVVLIYVFLTQTFESKLPSSTNVFKLIVIIPLISLEICQFIPLLFCGIRSFKFVFDRFKRLCLKVNQTRLSSDIAYVQEDFTTSRKNPILELKQICAGYNEIFLSRVDLKLGEHDLLFAIGASKSGKSSLLLTILRELSIRGGQMVVRTPNISYGSQEPWLFAGTIRQNIIFGDNLDIKRYKTVLEICRLNKELNSLPFADLTEIGDGGSGLSGGQKSRVSLARAVYKDADIYLLDEPLAALDCQTAAHIMKRCIKRFLSEKAVIVCTSQLQLLDLEDKIVLLEKGKITKSGLYLDLLHSKKELADILSIQSQQTTNTPEDNVQDEIPVDSELLTLSSVAMRYSINPGVTTTSAVTNFRIVSTMKGFLKLLWIFMVPTKRFLILAPLLMVAWIIAVSVKIYGENSLSTWLRNPDDTTKNYRMIFIVSMILYIGLSVIVMILNLFYQSYIIKRAHYKSLSKVIHSYVYVIQNFLKDIVLNRFSFDIILIELYVSYSFYRTFQSMFLSLCFLLYAASVAPVCCLFTIPAILFIILVTVNFTNNILNAYQIEASLKSANVLYLSATYRGLTTIHSSQMQDTLLSEYEYTLSHNFQNGPKNEITRLFLNTIIQTTVVLLLLNGIYFCFVYDGPSSIAGLAISYNLVVSMGLRQCGFEFTAFANYILSASRLFELYDLPEEEDNADQRLQETGFIDSSIRFDNFSFKYFSNLPFIINQLNLEIPPKTRIAIVGPSGAGKSTLFASILRMGFTSGTLTIGQVDISTIPLPILRRNISILPQEAVILGESIRTNLDPFDRHSDDEIMRALTIVKMIDCVQSLEDDSGRQCLDYISREGSEFGLGEKQLLCLAKILLENNRVVLIDEASSKVDKATQTIIQNVLSDNFKDSTVISIIHKLKDCVNCDLIMYVVDGQIVEMGTPFDLLHRPDSLFYGLARKAGSANFRRLQSLVSAENQTEK